MKTGRTHDMLCNKVNRIREHALGHVMYYERKKNTGRALESVMLKVDGITEHAVVYVRGRTQNMVGNPWFYFIR